MATTTIYICDRCESFMNNTDLVGVKLHFTGPGLERLADGELYNSSQDRQICFACLQSLMSQFKLNMKHEDLQEQLFNDFTVDLTRKKTHED